jgi:UDP-arabinose 4-epimerase
MSHTILVTGGAGYIGSHTVKTLHALGLEVIIFDNLSTGHHWAAQWGRFIAGDLSDRLALKQVFADHEIGAVIHFAANAYVGESMQNPGKYFRNNVVNTLNLLEVMHESDVKRIVFSSSCTTYGIPKEMPITEQATQNAISPYGESKLMCERLLNWYAICHNVRYTTLRYFNASGADEDGDLGEDHDPETHLIPLVIGAALRKYPPLKVFGNDYDTPDGSAVRDYIHVSDLADAHAKALQYLLEDNESIAINLGSGRGSSVQEIIQMTERILERPVPFELVGRRPGDPAILIADSKLALNVLGWQSQRNLEEIIRSASQWHIKAWRK